MLIRFLFGVGVFSGVLMGGAEAMPPPIREARLVFNEYRLAHDTVFPVTLALMEMVFKPAGIAIKGEAKPFLRAADDINNGRVDAHVGTFAVRWEGYLYPRWHYFTSRISVLSKRNPAETWRGYDSLAGKRIGWFRGYMYHLFFDKKVPLKVLELTSLVQCVGLLEAGRLDYCMDGRFNGLDPVVERLKLDPERYQIDEVYLEPVYLRFKDTPRSRRIIALYDQRMDELYRSGTLNRYFQKMGLPSIHPEQSALTRWPTVSIQEMLAGQGEWADSIEYLGQ